VGRIGQRLHSWIAGQLLRERLAVDEGLHLCGAHAEAVGER
jgi:hypothetical protein